MAPLGASPQNEAVRMQTRKAVATMGRRNSNRESNHRIDSPYNATATDDHNPAGVGSAMRSCASLIAYIVAMAALTIGMLWMLWKVSGR